MRITYKDVGQGDSIILEWVVKGEKKVGLIDCNLKGKKNPVLDHIRSKGYKVIDFIVLSHPHRDHFSGLLPLLNYVDNQGITILKFAHTLVYAGARKFWRYFEIDSKDTRQLNKMLRKIKSMKTAGRITNMVNLTEGVPLDLADNIRLICLSPAHDDGEEYQRLVEFNADENVKEASQAANHLSTVFLLDIDNQYGLFTSDAENFALEGVLRRKADLLRGKKIQICQLPHHGSENNHCITFWTAVEVTEVRHAIASAGEHRSYNHPSYDVLKAFQERGYTVHCTNILNGMAEFTELLEVLTERSDSLEGGSTLAEEYRKSGDRVFVFQDGQFTFNQD